MRHLGWLGVVSLVLATPTSAQQTPSPGADAPGATPVVSMGQPRPWTPYAGGGLALNELSGESGVGGSAFLGVERSLMNPITGGPTLVAEAYLGAAAGSVDGLDGGFRGSLALPILFTRFGADWNLRTEEVDFVLSVIFPPQRGGLFGRGGQLRIDWIPAREQTVNLGISVPVGRRWIGRTRPREIDVPLPRPPGDVKSRTHDAAVLLDDETSGILAGIRDYAMRLGRWGFPISWVEGKDYEEAIERADSIYRALATSLERGDALSPDGHSAPGDRAVYIRETDHLFGRAAGLPERGRELADSARAAVLDSVWLPYNGLMAQYKKPDGLYGLGRGARARFAAWVRGPSPVRQERHDAVMAAFDGWFAALADVQAWILERGRGDSRGTWLPMTLVLRPEQHDTRPEIDDLVERAVGAGFVGGNAAIYISGQQFQAELTNQIHAARDYHVLWIHDYRGKTPDGRFDIVGYHQAVKGYLAALTARVREYDERGRLPVYLLLFDQNYYEANQGHIWLSLLEDPLEAEVALPGGRGSSEPPGMDDRHELTPVEDMATVLAAWQDSLRAAVAGSSRLQAEAKQRGGADWIRRVVKVHVNVTHPSDLTFRTSRLLGLPFAGDNLIRDHRKIAFYDVTEADPGRGTAMFAGVGVGENYLSDTWEDRALLVQGPALVRLKTAARELLLANGFHPEEIPPPLQRVAYPADYDRHVEQLDAAGATARILQTQNSVGFARKEATVVQMLLYDLMPPGSVLYVPDSIWTSFLWTGQLVAAAFRGCHVYVIAPAAENAPSAAPMTLSRTQELYAQTVVIRQVLEPAIRRAGGRLRVGLYNRQTDIADVPALMREAAEGVRRNPMLREEFPLGEAFFDDWDLVADSLDRAGFEPPPFLFDEADRLPKLHRKTQFFASREALAALAADPAVVQRYRGDIRKASRSLTTRVATDPLVEDPRVIDEVPLLQAWDRLPARFRDEAPLYFAVGSLNKDWRGAALDGEALAVVSGTWALIGWIDFLYVSSRTIWLDDVERLQELLPPYSDFDRMLGRRLRNIL